MDKNRKSSRKQNAISKIVIILSQDSVRDTLIYFKIYPDFLASI